ncbi:hypothetical protein [Motilimonas eburnea]|uniref:hypothetical protein n=1 Tax=Motilimonas eburnea TaxID=1737488 RepID=UPI001E63785D|nr:hypothetical protein [Motilimonas eburnea]MCE2570047.1 hypothetical protein [Motilimonas eburnea]
MQGWHVDLRLLKAEHDSGYCVMRSSQPDDSGFITNNAYNPELFEQGVRAYLNAYSQNMVLSLMDKLGLDIDKAVSRINQYLLATDMVGKVSQPSNDSFAMKVQCEGIPKLLSDDELRAFLRPENVCPFWVSMSLRAAVNTSVSKHLGFDVLLNK